jgi:putative tryptophan/tyrosine transport system substrate-binding protein
VFIIGADPVQFGIVEKLGRPRGNVTGITQYYGALGAKRLEFLRELVPAPAVIAILSNPNNPNAELHLRDVQTAAQAIDQNIEVFHAHNEREVDTAFARLGERHIPALLVADDSFFDGQRNQIVALAARFAVPSIYYTREFAVAGGLISYGSGRADNWLQVGIYVGRILKGVKPADLPVLQPTKFELVINLKTAKALGLDIPPQLLARADEVIE